MDIVLREPGDLLRVATLDEAEREMEPIDVRNGEWALWDVTGRVLEPAIEEVKRGRRIFATTVERVVLRPTEERDPEGLTGAIYEWLVARGLEAQRPASLEEALTAWDRLG
jgi:hypothetical protein